MLVKFGPKFSYWDWNRMGNVTKNQKFCSGALLFNISWFIWKTFSVFGLFLGKKTVQSQHMKYTFQSQQHTTAASMNVVLVSGSSFPDLFCKKGILKNFAKFTRKHMRKSLLFVKKEIWRRFFSVNLAKFLRTSFLKEYLR